MKLRNKKTGEIKDTAELMYPDGIGMFFSNFDSLAELNEDWEDAPEEPTTYYYISDFGAIREGDVGKFVEDEIARKEIGNYFDTREEAEKAVEKLKAWKRLKDYNVKFNLDFVRNRIDFTYSINNSLHDVLDVEEQIFNNMKIIFGGEE